MSALLRIYSTLARHSFVRYLGVGASLFVLDLIVFLALVQGLNASPLLAQFVARATGAGAGFLGHRYVTFRQSLDAPRHGVAGQGGRYAAVALLTFLVSPWVVVAMLRVVGGHLVVAKVLAEVVLVLLTYAAMRVVFRRQEQS